MLVLVILIRSSKTFLSAYTTTTSRPSTVRKKVFYNRSTHIATKRTSKTGALIDLSLLALAIETDMATRVMKPTSLSAIRR